MKEYRNLMSNANYVIDTAENFCRDVRAGLDEIRRLLNENKNELVEYHYPHEELHDSERWMEGLMMDLEEALVMLLDGSGKYFCSVREFCERTEPLTPPTTKGTDEG